MWIKRNRVKNIVCPLLRWPQDCCIVGIIGWKGNKSCKNKRAMFHVLWGQCLWSPFIDISLVSITFTEYWKYSKSFSIIGDFFLCHVMSPYEKPRQWCRQFFREGVWIQRNFSYIVLAESISQDKCGKKLNDPFLLSILISIGWDLYWTSQHRVCRIFTFICTNILYKQ